jgi:Fanconi anemia group J protein
MFLNKWKKIPIAYEAVGLENNTWDIEDLVKQSKRKKICPYYAARDLAPIVDVIFCPYNYLIDPRIRSTVSLNVKFY